MKSKRRTRTLSEKDRAAKRTAERELMAKAIEALRSSEGWQSWLRVRRHFRTYSFHNQLLIAIQMPDATRVAGFRRWLDLGYVVRKDERAIRIWAPRVPSKKRIREWKEAGSVPEKKPRTFFRLVPVFDRSQVERLPDFPGGPVELEPPIEPVDGDSLAGLLEPLQGFAGGLEYTLAAEEIPGSARGYCAPSRTHIGVEVVSERFSANAQISVVIHELAHALVRCDRRDDDPKLTYAEEEVIVESVAYTVCSTVGLDTSRSSVPYMASWGDGSEIERYAGLIDRLASRLEDAVLVQELTTREPSAVVA